MKTICLVGRGLLFAVFCLGISAAFSPAVAQKKGAMKIGTYDSRQVVMAYASTDQFKEKVQKISEETGKMLESQDSTVRKEGALKMVAFSYNLEKTVFSSASAADILALIKDQLPELAKQAGVSVIVSKWELTWADPKIETVDLTNQVMALFKPTEENVKAAAEMSANPPISQDEYGMGESIDMWEMFKARYKIK
jgi:hypothetical protein